MRYTLLVLSSPDLGVGNQHALGFANAALLAGHQLDCVFFYDAGALTALSSTEGAQDEDGLREHWQQLAREYRAPLKVCIASAARFGLGEPAPSDRLLDGFEIVGLGDFVEAQTQCERLLTFAD